MADRVVRSPQRNGNGNGATPHPPTNGSAPPDPESSHLDEGLPRVRIRRVRRVSGPFTAIPQLRREGLFE